MVGIKPIDLPIRLCSLLNARISVPSVNTIGGVMSLNLLFFNAKNYNFEIIGVCKVLIKFSKAEHTRAPSPPQLPSDGATWLSVANAIIQQSPMLILF
jgi:hypothetical protein